MANDTLDLEQLIGWDSLLHDDERQVRASVRRIVKDRFMPRIVADYEAGKFALELVPELAKQGLLGANLEGYGCWNLPSPTKAPIRSTPCRSAAPSPARPRSEERRRCERPNC
jgi:alkylation response protein AidB-like acyl-CoA dehydrogenase